MGSPIPTRSFWGEIVEEPDQLRRPAAGDDGRPWDRTVIPPQLVRGQLRMEGMCDLPGVNLIERGVFRNRPRAGDVERLRPVGVHGIACVSRKVGKGATVCLTGGIPRPGSSSRTKGVVGGLEGRLSPREFLRAPASAAAPPLAIPHRSKSRRLK